MGCETADAGTGEECTCRKRSAGTIVLPALVSAGYAAKHRSGSNWMPYFTAARGVPAGFISIRGVRVAHGMRSTAAATDVASVVRRIMGLSKLKSSQVPSDASNAVSTACHSALPAATDAALGVGEPLSRSSAC